MYEKIMLWLPLALTILGGILAIQQVRLNNITNARIRWLEELKKLISDFFSECNTIFLKDGISAAVDERRKLDSKNENDQMLYDRINESLVGHLNSIDVKYNLITLNLNPKEPLHIKFEKMLEEYIALFNQIPTIDKKSPAYFSHFKKINSYSDALLMMTRYITKLEWEKTKRPYLSHLFHKKIGKGRALIKKAMSIEVKKIES